jgi:hypothetical protein
LERRQAAEPCIKKRSGGLDEVNTQKNINPRAELLCFGIFYVYLQPKTNY